MSLAPPSRRLLFAPPPAPAKGDPPDMSTVLDLGEGRAWYNGVRYADEASLLAASGGVKTGSAITFGPILPPDAPELVTNWDFSDGTTGWTASVQSGGAATIGASGGELTLTANASVAASVLQSVATELGVAYRLAAKVKRGTITTAGPGGIALAGAVAGLTKNATTTTYVEDARFIPSLSSAAMSVGGRIFGATDTGSVVFDYISLKKVVPFVGYRAGGFAARIKARAPATAPAAATVIYKADSAYVSGASETDQTSSNNVVLTYDSGTGKTVRLNMTFAGTSVVALALGQVEFDTDFEVVINVLPNRVAACIVGQKFVGFDTTTNNGIPGVAAVRVGRSLAGEQFTGTIKRVRQWDAAFSDARLYAHILTDAAFVAWGDSLTAGAGVTAAQTYPEVMSGLYSPARSVINLGVGGQTSTQIAARMGAQPISVTVSGNQIPASGGVSVTAKSINPLYNSGAYGGTMTGTLAGISGTMSTDASGNWTFTRAVAGAVASCPSGTVFVPDLPDAVRARKSLLWLGRNGAQSGYDILTDIAAAVASLGHTRYLVGSILTASGDSAGVVTTITGRNTTLASTYGARFVDILAALQAANDGSANDLADVAAGWTPRSLRSDSTHLNAAGYAIVAAQVKAAADALGL